MISDISIVVALMIMGFFILEDMRIIDAHEFYL